jgi:hypothetical protein
MDKHTRLFSHLDDGDETLEAHAAVDVLGGQGSEVAVLKKTAKFVILSTVYAIDEISPFYLKNVDFWQESGHPNGRQ